MADNKLVGQNYTTPDLVAKVTGAAKYAEDYRVEGMLFAKILSSPMPHAKVTRLDTSKALAMPGVKAILTADDMPGAAAGATLGEGVQATAQAERGPDQRAAVSRRTDSRGRRHQRSDRRRSDRGRSRSNSIPLPFVVDPIESLRPNGANARTQGNVWMRPAAAAGSPRRRRSDQQRTRRRRRRAADADTRPRR
jgi:CO/xanthine dehydrogenase Mo-binding subunit